MRVKHNIDRVAAEHFIVLEKDLGPSAGKELKRFKLQPSLERRFINFLFVIPPWVEGQKPLRCGSANHSVRFRHKPKCPSRFIANRSVPASIFRTPALI